MRLSKTLIPTLKEAPAEAEIPSLYPDGTRRLPTKGGSWRLLVSAARLAGHPEISRIIREEMTAPERKKSSCRRSSPPSCGRSPAAGSQYGEELLRFKDRKGADFVIGPTHEEVDRRSWCVATSSSSRQLPLNLYQIQSKFRDELRPRAGLMRGREFIMKDAYSFHATEEDAKREYKNMYDTYTRIFTRCGSPSARSKPTPAPSAARSRTSSRC